MRKAKKLRPEDARPALCRAVQPRCYGSRVHAQPLGSDETIAFSGGFTLRGGRPEVVRPARERKVNAVRSKR